MEENAQNQNFIPRMANNNEESIFNCFSYMFKIKNIAIYAIFTYLAIVANTTINQYSKVEELSLWLLGLLLVVSIVVYPVIYGYLFTFIEALTQQHGIYQMPTFKYWNSWGRICKFCISVAIGILPLIIPLILLASLLSTADPALKFIGLVILLGLIVWFCIFMYFLPGFCWLYSNKKYWTTFLKYQEVFELIQRNNKRYLKTIGIYLAASVICMLICIPMLLPFLTQVTNELNQTTPAINSLVPIFINSAIGTYMFFVLAYVCAKCISANELNS